MNNFDDMPIIEGVGQKIWRDPEPNRTPIDALTEASALALVDASEAKLKDVIDTAAMVRFIADPDPGMGALFPRRAGGDISAWAGEPEAEPTTFGQERDGLNDAEKPYGLYEPINTYPLFENSLRHHLGTPADDHQKLTARLCSTVSGVAANNPHAWKQEALSPQQVSTVDEKNRYIGYPYTKAMNPVLAVDMAASVIITSGLPYLGGPGNNYSLHGVAEMVSRLRSRGDSSTGGVVW